MTLRGLTASAVLVASLLSGVPGELLYLCKMDRQVRFTCCCAHETKVPEQPTVAPESCCEIAVVPAHEESGWLQKPTTAPDPVLLLVLPTYGASGPLLHETLPPPAGIGPAPPSDRPVFLKTRTLLI